MIFILIYKNGIHKTYYEKKKCITFLSKQIQKNSVHKEEIQIFVKNITR